MKMRRLFLLFTAIFVLILVQSASADDDRYVRLRWIEGDVRVQGADGQRPEEATVNFPVLDGDEVITEDGRAELSFRNGIIVRIGDYSGVRLESAYTPMRLVLLQGTVFVDSNMIDSFRDELEISAGDAQVYLIDEGNMRVDMGTEGTVRVTSNQGEVEVRASGQRVLLEAGERTYVDPGSDPERPEEMYGELDELDEWNESRVDSYARYDREPYDDYVDDSIYYDSYELSQYGNWRTYGDYGNVWVPSVSIGWRPYNDGRWVFANGGWFWVSYEPWGWAPYHYGRWGYADFGWYWIPGRTFGPAWVSWYDYGDYIGWCPLNYYNRPIYGFHNYYDYYRYPRIQKQKTIDITDSWTFVKKREIGARNVKKISAGPAEVKKIKLDDKRIIRSPQKELARYVMPKTAKPPAYVNDQRVVKRPADIRNPYGAKNRYEEFERGKAGSDRDAKRGSSARDNSKDVIKKQGGSRAPQPDWQKQRDERSNKPKASPPKIEKRNYSQRAPSFNRDAQFERKSSSPRKPYSSYESPYYRERKFEKQRSNDNDRSVSPWFRERYEPRDNSGKNDKSGDQREVNPRYHDEARKIFERFEEKRSTEQRRYTPQPRYEPPKRDYKPDVKRNYDRPKSYSKPPSNRGNSSHKPVKKKD